jgi:DNA-binding NarL/FixJ family response regulator
MSQAKGNLMDSIRVLVAENDEEVGSSLAIFLASAGMTVARATADSVTVTEEAACWRPHVILINVHLLGNPWSTSVEQLKRELPGVRLVLTGPGPHAAYAQLAAALGADLYLSEALPPREWLRRLRTVVIQRANGALEEEFIPPGSCNQM